MKNQFPLPKNLHSTGILLAKVVLVCLPTILTLLPLQVIYGSSPLDFVPSNSDEQMYWRVATTFGEVGFNGGYHTIEELTAPIEQVRFYAWGPIYPMIYGSLNRLIGNPVGGLIIINVLLVTLSLIYLVLRAKPNLKQSALMAATLVSVSAIMLFLATGQAESLHHSVAISLGTYFYILLTQPETVSTQEKLGGGVFLVVASLARPSWALLLLPLVWFYSSKLKAWWLRLLLSLSAVLLVFLIYLTYLQIATPFPGVAYSDVRTSSLLELASRMSTQALLTGSAFFEFNSYILQSQRFQLMFLFAVILLVFALHYFKPRYWTVIVALALAGTGSALIGSFVFTLDAPTAIEASTLAPISSRVYRNYQFLAQFSEGVYQLHNYQFLLLTIGSMVLLVSNLWRRSNEDSKWNVIQESVFYLFVLLAAFGAIVFGHSGRQATVFRHISIFTVFIGTILSLRGRMGLIFIFAVVGLWLSPLVLHLYQHDRVRSYTGNLSSNVEFAHALDEHITFSPANNPWCNTILVDLPSHCDEFGYR